MRLNTTKCKVLFIPSKTNINPPIITLNGEQLEVVNSYKYLGVELNTKLDWSQQWNRVLKLISSIPYLIKQLKRLGFREEILVNVYRSLVISHIDYSCLVLTSTNCTIKNEMVGFQNRILRIIGISSVKAESTYNIIDVTDHIEKTCVQKIQKMLDDPDHYLTIKLTTNTRSYALHKLRTEKARTETYNKSIVPTAVRIIKNGKANMYNAKTLEDHVQTNEKTQKREKGPDFAQLDPPKPQAPCPICGKLYEATRGVKTHQTRMHP